VEIYSAPKAVLTHIQWSLSDAIGHPVDINWSRQPLRSGTWKSSISWSSSLGAGARIATTLRGWHYLNFEVYEAALNGSDGSIFLFTPELGLFRANIGPHGDIVLNEHQISNAMKTSLQEGELTSNLERMLGVPWHESLEPFRRVEIDGAESTADKISV
jgi:hypothetical protein